MAMSSEETIRIPRHNLAGFSYLKDILHAAQWTNVPLSFTSLPVTYADHNPTISNGKRTAPDWKLLSAFCAT